MNSNIVTTIIIGVIASIIANIIISIFRKFNISAIFANFPKSLIISIISFPFVLTFSIIGLILKKYASFRDRPMYGGDLIFFCILIFFYLGAIDLFFLAFKRPDLMITGWFYRGSTEVSIATGIAFLIAPWFYRYTGKSKSANDQIHEDKVEK